MRLTDRKPLEDVREEAQLLVRGHGPLISVLALGVEDRLLLLLLHVADIHEGADVADVELLAKFAKTGHLSAQTTEALSKGTNLTRTLKAELAASGTDVGILTSAPQSEFPGPGEDVRRLPRTLEAKLATGSADVGQLTRALETHLRLSRPDIRQLICALQAQLAPSGPNVRQLSGPTKTNIGQSSAKTRQLPRALEAKLTVRGSQTPKNF